MTNDNEITIYSRVLSQFAANKKKTVMAVSLICVMAFMWIRVFTKTEPKGAEAAISEQVLQESKKEKPRQRLTYIELPKIEGRHDVIRRDFFKINSQFLGDESKAESKDKPEIEKDEFLESVKKSLKVGAISFGEKPQAFINDQLVSAGDKVSILINEEEIEIEISEIKENVVRAKFGQRLIELTCSGD